MLSPVVRELPEGDVPGSPVDSCHSLHIIEGQDTRDIVHTLCWLKDATSLLPLNVLGCCSPFWAGRSRHAPQLARCKMLAAETAEAFTALNPHATYLGKTSSVPSGKNTALYRYFLQNSFHCPYGNTPHKHEKTVHLLSAARQMKWWGVWKCNCQAAGQTNTHGFS